MFKKIGDLSFGLNKQVLTILTLLSHTDIEVDDDEIDFDTYPWYNGRERAVCIKIQRFLSNRILLVVFGEHRNSDDIFVDIWEVSKLRNSNCPTIDDFTDEAFKNRKFFECWDFKSAIDYILFKTKSL